MIRRLVFYHINKCAGTTLLFKLPNSFRHDQCLFIDQEMTGELQDNEFGYPNYDRVNLSRFIHEPSGARNWKERLPNVTTFAMFRNPIDRLYSEWMMICSWRETDVLDNPKARSLLQSAKAGFDYYVTTDDPLISLQRWNGMTGYLMFGDQPMIERWRASEGLYDPAFARQALELALANLRSLDIIGLMEYFDKSVDMLDLLLPCPPAAETQSYNTRGGRSYLYSIAPSTLSAAKACTALDQVVYECASDLFRKQIDRLHAEYGPDLKTSAAKRHQKVITTLPEWALVSMGDALNGTGWHGREINGSKISRWMGPGNVATVDIPLCKENDILVRARCTSFMTLKQLEVLTLKVDSHPVPLETWTHLDRYRYFESTVMSSALKRGEPLHLEFNCEETHRAMNPDDPRSLGLEFCEIEIGPVSGFRKGGPGTPDLLI